MYVCLKKERKKVLLFTWGWAYSCLWPVGWVPASSRSVWRNHCRPSSWPKPTAVAVVWHSLFRGSSCRWVDTFPPHADRTNTKKKKEGKRWNFLYFYSGMVSWRDKRIKRQRKKKKKEGYLTVSGADRSCCVLLLWAVEEFLKSIFSSILSWERDRSRVSTNAFKSAILRRFVPTVVVLALELLFIIIPLWLLWPPMLQQLLLLAVISCSLRSVCSVGLDPASVTRR